MISGRGSTLAMGMTLVKKIAFSQICVQHFITNRIQNKWQEVLSSEQTEQVRGDLGSAAYQVNLSVLLLNRF